MLEDRTLRRGEPVDIVQVTFRALICFVMGRGTMRTFRLSAIIISFVTLVLSSPSNAACGPGHENCEPSENEVQAKVEQLLNSAYLTPHSIVSLNKFDGRSFETEGRKTYEIRISVVLNYSDDKLLCRISSCPELHNYVVRTDAAEKKVTVAGWLFFEQVGQGWR